MTLLAIYMVVISALAAQFMRHRTQRREEVYRQRAQDEAERVAAAMNPYFPVGRLERTIPCDDTYYTYEMKVTDVGTMRFYVNVTYDTKLRYFGPYEGFAPLHLDPPDNEIVYERTVKMACKEQTMHLCIDTWEMMC